MCTLFKKHACSRVPNTKNGTLSIGPNNKRIIITKMIALNPSVSVIATQKSIVLKSFFLSCFQISCYAIPSSAGDPGSDLSFVSLVPGGGGGGSGLDDAALLSMLENPEGAKLFDDMEALTALSLIADLAQADQVLIERLAQIVRERKKASRMH